jgi:hypothetical protein
MDGPTGRPAANLPNSEGVGVCHQTVPELMVSVYWQHGPPIWQQFSLDAVPDKMWLSRTVANTNYEYLHSLSYSNLQYLQYSLFWCDQ